jgi:hypothetical protein
MLLARPPAAGLRAPVTGLIACGAATVVVGRDAAGPVALVAPHRRWRWP